MCVCVFVCVWLYMCVQEFVRLALSEEGGPDTRTQPEKKQLDV